MILRELKVNLKSFLIWFGVLFGVFLLVYLIYPFIVTDDTMNEVDAMLKGFPPELLKAFNMDLANITTAYGWFKTEGFMFILLIIGFYSSMLGGTILLKEESDKTIEYLESLPIKRSRVVTNKIVVGIGYILLLVLLFGIFNFISFKISGDFDEKQFLLLSITPILAGLPLFSINLFLSLFMRKTKRTIGISLGLVFVFYILSILSDLSSNVEFLKYFSVYTLADVRNVMEDVCIQPVMVLISLILSIIFIAFSYIRYHKKEFL